MEKSLNDYIKVGLLQAMTYPKSITDELEYFRSLESILSNPYFSVVEIIPPLKESMIPEVRNMIKKASFDTILTASLEIYGRDLDLNSFEENERVKAVDGVKKVIEKAAQLDITRVHMVSGKQVPSIFDREKAKNVLVKSIYEICNYAQKFNQMEIILEIHDYSIDRKRFIGPSVDARHIAETVCKEFNNFGLMQDLSHFPLIKETSYAALTTVKEFLTHIHVGNCVVKEKGHPLYGDKHPMFSIPEGEVGVKELAEFLEVLFAIGYLSEGEQSSISVEISTFEGQDPNEIIKNAKDTMEKAWEIIKPDIFNIELNLHNN